MKNKFTKVLILALTVIMLFGSLQAFGFEAYETYTYSIDGEPLNSPTAYSAEIAVNSAKMGLDVPLSTTACNDIFADNEGNVYIADTGNHRIVVLDKYYRVKHIIKSYVDEYGRTQTFNNPYGLYVTDPTKTVNKESYVYVCDRDNSRVVIFDRDYNYVRTIERPENPLLEEAAFKPEAIAVDIYGRIFIVSQSCFEGVIVLSGAGDFTGFIGAQKTTYSILESIWRRFQTKEQRAASEKNISIAFNNITVDDLGFVYATLTFDEKDEYAKQLAAIQSKASAYSPIKKLNSMGKEILNRNGFFDPSGEVNILNGEDVSMLIDVSLGAEGAWTILDSKRSRTYTYDKHGNLLYAFGDQGDQLGNNTAVKAMTYQVVDGVYYMIILDSTNMGYRFTVYAPTEYCNTITNALHNENENNYSASIDYWQDVLTRNNNFDLAYIGIGKALYSQGDYDGAMKMLENAYETTTYSKAFAEVRKGLLSKLLLPFVAIIIVLVVLLVKFLGWAKKKNKAVSLKVGRKTYAEELLFVFHLIFHPFDGFWDLKHEKRGSVRAATTILCVTILAFFYQSIGQGYMFNPRDTYSSIFVQILSIGVPVVLWTVSNWCLTTLFDGEGGLKDIYIATCYSLTPLPIFVVISTILTNFMTATEGSMVSLLVSIAFVWMIILLFFGMVVTHDYTINKNIITTIGTIVAAAVIMFIALLFSSLVVKMVTLIVALFEEVGNRI